MDATTDRAMRDLRALRLALDSDGATLAQRDEAIRHVHGEGVAVADIAVELGISRRAVNLALGKEPA